MVKSYDRPRSESESYDRHGTQKKKKKKPEGTAANGYILNGLFFRPRIKMTCAPGGHHSFQNSLHPALSDGKVLISF